MTKQQHAYFLSAIALLALLFIGLRLYIADTTKLQIAPASADISQIPDKVELPSTPPIRYE